MPPIMKTRPAGAPSRSPIRGHQSKLPIDDDPSARNLFLADPERPHGQPVLIPCRAVRFPDRHGLVGCLESTYRARYVSVMNLALLANVGKV